MALSERDRQKIVENTSAWINQDFGGLDLSGFPNFTPPAPAHKDRFEKRDGPFSSSASALREFIASPDTESLERVSKEIGHETLVDEVRNRKGEIVAQKFKLARPAYIPCGENLHSLVVTAAYNWLQPSDQGGDDEALINKLIDSGAWTVERLCAVFDTLNAEGLMVLAAGEPRNLTTAERLKVSRLAQSGKLDQAIGYHISCALDRDDLDLELVNDPDYRDVCDSAVWTVWEESTHDYTSTPSREAFLRRHCGNRPVTIPLLNAAWAELKKREASHARSEILGQIQRPQAPQPVNEKQLDALDDTAVDRLYHDSLRAYADAVRRAPGVLA